VPVRSSVKFDDVPPLETSGLSKYNRTMYIQDSRARHKYVVYTWGKPFGILVLFIYALGTFIISFSPAFCFPVIRLKLETERMETFVFIFSLTQTVL